MILRDNWWNVGNIKFGPTSLTKNEFSYEELLEAKYEKDEEGNCVIEVPVPGFNKSNINITLKKSTIVVKGETKTRTLYKNVYVNDKVSDVKATIQDGLLLLKLIYKDIEETKKIPID